MKPNPKLKVGDPVVSGGVKYRVVEILRVARLEGRYTDSEPPAVSVDDLTWDAVAGVWRD